MFIYIDETFNLEKGNKNQFMAVAGFSTASSTLTARWYQKLKRKALPKQFRAGEIKSTDRFTERYILPYLFSKKTAHPEIAVYIVIQHKNLLKQKYYYKGELNYDRLYINLVKLLLITASSRKKNDVVTIVTLDTFKPKLINKEGLAATIEAELKLEYPESSFTIDFGTSEEANLQFADQICGMVCKYLKRDSDYLVRLKKIFKVKIILNPFE